VIAKLLRAAPVALLPLASAPAAHSGSNVLAVGVRYRF
jgi:hypothetical protein